MFVGTEGDLMGKDKFSSFINSIVESAVKDALSESVESYRTNVFENESDNRARMSRALDARYLEEQEDAEEVKASEERAEKAIPREKIAPGGDAEAEETEEAEAQRDVSIQMPSEEQIQNPEFDTVVTMINELRSGSSLKDQAVLDRFKEYFDGLPEAEQRLLVVFSTALAQIIKVGEPASEVLTPSKAGIKSSGEVKVKADADEEPVEVTVKDVPDDGATAPIVVGEHKAVQNLLRKVRSSRG